MTVAWPTRLMCVVSIALIGCTKDVGDAMNAPGRAAADPLPVQAYPNPAFIDGAEKFIVHRGQPTLSRQSSGVTRVHVPLRSTAGLAKTLRYKITFLDRRGLAFEQSPRWRQIRVEGGAAFELIGQTMDPRAADFRCVVGQKGLF